jgi:hypothetical protein
MRILRLPYILLAAVFLLVGFGAGVMRTLQLDWYGNHKALNTTIGAVNWTKYRLKRGILDIKRQLSFGAKPGLPRVELYISIQNQEALMENPPDSTKKWRQAFMKYPDGSLQKIKMRYRGDNPANWLFMKKSIRIKTSKKRLINNQRVFNYNAPQTPALVELFLGLMAAKDAGILSSSARMVEMFINDEPYGVLTEYTQPGEVFLRNSGQMPINLYKGEQTHIERSESIELDLFNNPSLWKKVAVGNDLPAENFSDLSYFLNLIRRAVNDEKGYESLKRIAPFSVWSRYAAYQALTQNSHNDGFHNQRLVVDPWRGEVYPMMNDPMFVSHEITNQIDIDTQSLLRLYNVDPYFTLEKYRKLYSFLMKDKLLERGQQRIKNLVKPLLVSAERDSDIWRDRLWPEFPFKGPSEKLKILLNQYSLDIAEHRRWLIKQLEAEPEARWQNIAGRLELEVDKFAPMYSVSIRLQDGAQIPTRISWDTDGNNTLSPGDTKIPFSIVERTITLNAAWLANRSVKEQARYRSNSDYLIGSTYMRATKFTIVTDVPLEVTALKGRNALTDKEFDLIEGIVDGAWPSRRNRPVIALKKPPLLTWSGEKIFTGTNYIDNPVKIEPGTLIKMGPGANLVFRQLLEITGTAKSPIVIKPSHPSKPFGLIALQGKKTAGSSIRYLTMENGSGGRLLNIQYTGMLNIHNTHDIKLSNIKISDNHVTDDMLHIVYSDNVSVEYFETKNARADAIDIDIAKNVRLKGGIIQDSGNDGIDLMTSDAIIEDVIISQSKDKAISVGEGSQVLLKNSQLISNTVGIASKDDSKTTVLDVKFTSNKKQLAAYKKNWRYGTGGKIEISNSLFTGANNTFNAGEQSFIQIKDSIMLPMVKPGNRMAFSNVRKNKP